MINLKKYPATLIFVCTAIIFSLWLNFNEIISIDIRFALMVENMRDHGIGVFATVNNQPYADYLSPYTFLSFLTSFGGRWINMWSLALPTILLASYVTAMTYKIGARIKPAIGIYSVIFAFLTFEYLNICRQFSIDMPVAAATVTIIYLLMERSRKSIFLIPLCLFFAFAMRGPLGLIISGGAFGGWLLFRAEWKRVFFWGFIGAICSAICAAVTVFLIFRQGGQELWEIFLDWQISSRLKDGDNLYFFTGALGSFSLVYPVAAAVFILNYKKLAFWVKSDDTDTLLLRGLLGWALLPLIALSVPGCKHLRYMTAVIPALCLAAAYGASRLQDFKFNSAILKFISWLEYLVLPGLAVVIVVFHLITKSINPDAGSLLIVPLVAVTILIYCQYKYGKRLTNPILRLAWIAAAATLTFNILIFAPWFAKYDNSSRFVAEVEAQRHGDIYFYNIGPDHDDLKYFIHLSPERRRGFYYIFNNISTSKMYPVAGGLELFPQLPSGDVVVVKKRDIPELRKRIAQFDQMYEEIFDGFMAHRPFVAFRKK